MPRSSAPAQRRNGSGASASSRSVSRKPRASSAADLHEHKPRQDPDVFLNVPDLHVDELELDVENLEAHLALQARLANLLDLRPGAHVTIEKVQLDIKGVTAKAMLKVRLENVYAILDRTFTSLDRNPQILEGVIETAEEALGPSGLLGDTLEGVSRSVRSNRTNGGLAHLGAGLRSLRRAAGRIHGVDKLAAAAGVVGGVALAARNNGGIEKTFKELTS